MKRFVILTAGLACAAVPLSASASGLIAPFSLESAQVMPKGVRSLRMVGLTTEISDRFDGGGNIVSLASDLNRGVTVSDILKTQPAGFDREQLEGGLAAMGLTQDQLIGVTLGAANARVTNSAPTLVYGLTEKITVAVAVPIVYSNLNMSSGWVANSTMQGLVDQASKEGMYGKIASFQTKLQNVVATKLQALGYEPLHSETHTDLGDILLVSKFQVLKKDRFAVSVSPRVSLPTGRQVDPNKVVDLAPGDGQWDLGVTTAADFIYSNRLTLTAAAGYTYQFASTKTKRIPNSWDESLSSDVDTGVTQKFGDTMGSSLALRFLVAQGWTLGTAYSYQYKLPDAYSGTKYSGERYGYLAHDSQQRLQAAQASVSYTTLPLFLAKKFPMPLEATLSFSGILAAQNTALANFTNLELVSFF